MQENVFVLDIGTRSVVALWASLEEGEMVVEHLLFREHQTRAMFDGQIHHVEEVAEIVVELVQEMEHLIGRELKKVAVAAAGRTLETVRGTAKIVHPVSTAFTKEEVLSLELQAVQEAQAALPKNQAEVPLSLQYYCVGYSIVEERLDQVVIGSLVGQKGETAEIEIIATFLPRMVVDSLQIVVEKAGLEINSITLEPIAVANLVLNPAMRRLNLVLVDIGAGTSDIAVCGANFISAFGMVPLAGDEITEALSEQYLLDFNRAEEVKKQLAFTSEIRTVSILGQEAVYQTEEIRNSLLAGTERLAEAIAETVLALNGKPPQALLLVGGGSLTPQIEQKLGDALNLPGERIAVQEANKIQHLRNLPEEFNGPNFITSLAIAYTALIDSTMSFITVYINEKPVRMLNLAQNNVAGALLAGGYNLRELYARPGNSLTYELAGQIYSIPGGEGKPGQILLNEQEVSFSEVVRHEDWVKFIPGEVGAVAEITFAELFKEQCGICYLNGAEVDLFPVIKVAGVIKKPQDFLEDGSVLEMENNCLIENVLQQAGLFNPAECIFINGQEVALGKLGKVTKNGEKATMLERVFPGDQLVFEPLEQIYVQDLVSDKPLIHLEVIVNEQPVKLSSLQVWLNKTKINPREAISLKAGDVLDYQMESPLYKPILVDVFNEINFSTEPPPGKTRLLILLNGVEREYTYPLQQGDRIEIVWE